MPLIEVRDLTVRYPRSAAPALKGVSFQIREGEMLLLLGPSGSGKSTLGLCLAGLIPSAIPASVQGDILLRDRDASGLTAAERTASIGIVFQDPEAQFCMLTVEDEVAFGLENMAVPPEAMESRIRESLDLVGLGARRRERLDRLSGGQKQRLALACVLARRPSVLLLDEPTANLDPAARHDFFRLLGDLRRERPALTILLVEHILDDLISLVDRVLLLDADGTLCAAGEPTDVFNTRDEELDRMGIWLPQVTALGHKLRLAGLTIPRLPLTVSEAALQIGPMLTKRVLEERPRIRQCVSEQGASGGPAAISVHDLTFRYAAGPPVLRGIKLDVQTGSFLAVVGPNASGKTTLVSHFAQILPAHPNHVWLFGKDIASLTTAQMTEQVGFVFQNPEHQFVEGTVEAELAYSLRARRRPPDETTAIVDRLLESFSLTAHRHRNPFRLSQGQKRRLSVATMLAVGQRVLILDEPTFGQDRNTAHALMDQICALHRAGQTIIIVTHDMQLVADYANEVVVLLDGRVHFTGSTPGLFAAEHILEEASLRPPPLHTLARALGIGFIDQSSPLTIREWMPFFGLDGSGRAPDSVHP